MNIKQNMKSIGINIASVALAVAIGVPLGNLFQEKFLQKSFIQPLVPLTLSDSTYFFKGIDTDLILYADTKCNYCKEGIALLDKVGASYTIYFIDKDPAAKNAYEMLDTGGVPALLSRRQYMSGYNEKSWEEFLLLAKSN